MQTENENNEVPVIVLEPEQINALYQQPETKEALVKSIASSVLSIVPDISTAKGRDQIKSLAYRVTRSKTAVLEVGKKMIADLRAKYEADTEQARGVVKYLEDELTALAKKVRQPLTDWEEARKKEAERAQAREAEIKRLGIPFDEFGRPLDLEGLRLKLSSLNEYTPETQDEEDAIEQGKALLSDAVRAEEKRIEDAKELARLKAEDDERKRIEAQLEAISTASGLSDEGELLPPDVIRERIANLQGVRSDNDRVRRAVNERLYLLEAQLKESQANEEASRERVRAESFSRAVEDVRGVLEDAGMSLTSIAHAESVANRLAPVTEDEKQTAADLKLKIGNKRNELERAAEEARKQREEQIAREAEERAKREAEERAAKQAEEAKRAQEEAVRKERERIEADARKQAEDKAKREADQSHRAKVNGEALADLVAHAGLSDDEAKVVVVAIATGKVRHVTVAY